ncbi:MAG: flavin reductase [Myxococcales bacterium]|nr:flavin reductase [Myxococcales bacterium]
MGSFAAGVTVLTTVDADRNLWGMTATAFSSLSLEPPLCLVCVDHRAGCHAVLEATRHFAINMLSGEQQELSNRFASRSPDKFAGLAYALGDASGCPLLAGALATVECVVRDVFAGGDHSIFVGSVIAATVNEGTPLAYWRGKYSGLASL